MRERPKLFVSRKPARREVSPWQTENPPWLDELQQRRTRKRWQQRIKLGFSLIVVSIAVFMGVATSRFEVRALEDDALKLAKSVVSSASLYVIDGDTIRYKGETIRIANIDTPEISGAQCDSELRRALDAKAALKALLDGESLDIRRGDPETGRTIDKYGRTLALVSVRGRDVGKILIQQKHARPWIDTGCHGVECTALNPNTLRNETLHKDSPLPKDFKYSDMKEPAGAIVEHAGKIIGNG